MQHHNTMFDVYYWNPICRMIKLAKWIRENDSSHLRRATHEKFLEYYEKNKELDDYISKYEDYYVWYLNNHLTNQHINAILKYPAQEVQYCRKVVRTVINLKSDSTSI